MSQNVNLNDFAYGSGFDGGVAGMNTPEALAELRKALTAGQVTGGSTVNQTTAGSGASLKVEALDRVMKILSFDNSHLRLWNLIPKTGATNTVEEFNQLKSYGSEFGGALNEGQLGEEEDSTYVRRTEKIKYYGEVGSVTLPMQMVKSFDGQGALQREIKNRTMNLLRKMNKALAFGSEKVVGQEINGIYRQHEIGIGYNDSYSDNPSSYYSSPWVIDLKGAALTQDKIEQAGTIISQDGFGYASHVFGTPGVFSNFAQDYYEKQRIILGGNGFPSGGVNVSYPKEVTLSFGNVKLEHDLFLIKKSIPVLSGTAQTSSKSPNIPTSSTVSVAATDTTGEFKAAYAGDYKWAVRSKNLYGFSALLELDASAAVAIAATESADLTFADGGGAYAATGYQILRTEDGGSQYFPIFEVSTAELQAGYNGAAAGKVRDRNFSIPNTEDASIVDLANTLLIQQLAPLMKLDLAVQGPANRFMLMCYFLLRMHNPNRMVRFVNAKHTSN